MEALRKKWNSSRGASILLALLFLLVCIMVGASVVMAAASNVGKIQSNKEEQQKYLTLSSAVTMLVDELERIEYVGMYGYQKYTEKIPESGTDPDGNPITIEVEHTIYAYEQLNGELRLRKEKENLLTESELWQLKGVLPLNNELEEIFAAKIDAEYKGCGCTKGDLKTDHYVHYIYKPAHTGSESPVSPFELEFEVNDNNYGGLSDDKVRIQVTLRTDGSIKLIATLWEKTETANPSGGSPTVTWKESDYTMEALLRPDPDEWPEKRFVLPNNPIREESGGKYSTDPIRWKLKYIFKKEADPNATPTS